MLKNINESNIQKMYTAITHFHERKKKVLQIMKKQDNDQNLVGSSTLRKYHFSIKREEAIVKESQGKKYSRQKKKKISVKSPNMGRNSSLFKKQKKKAKVIWTIIINGDNGEKSCWKVEKGKDSQSMLWKFDSFKVKQKGTKGFKHEHHVV